MGKMNLRRNAKKDTEVVEENVEKPETVEEKPAQAQSAGGDELSALRSILLGSLQNDQEQALARLENRIASQSTKLRHEFDELVRRLDNRIAELDSRSTKDQAELREQLISQSNLLNDAIEERTAQVTQLVSEGLDELRETKIDRKRFSMFLAGLTAHLNDEKAPSGNGELRLGRPPWHPVRSS